MLFEKILGPFHKSPLNKVEKMNKCYSVLIFDKLNVSSRTSSPFERDFNEIEGALIFDRTSTISKKNKMLDKILKNRKKRSFKKSIHQFQIKSSLSSILKAKTPFVTSSCSKNLVLPSSHSGVLSSVSNISLKSVETVSRCSGSALIDQCSCDVCNHMCGSSKHGFSFSSACKNITKIHTEKTFDKSDIGEICKRQLFNSDKFNSANYDLNRPKSKIKVMEEMFTLEQQVKAMELLLKNIARSKQRNDAGSTNCLDVRYRKDSHEQVLKNESKKQHLKQQLADSSQSHNEIKDLLLKNIAKCKERSDKCSNNCFEVCYRKDSNEHELKNESKIQNLEKQLTVCSQSHNDIKDLILKNIAKCKERSDAGSNNCFEVRYRKGSHEHELNNESKIQYLKKQLTDSSHSHNEIKEFIKGHNYVKECKINRDSKEFKISDNEEKYSIVKNINDVEDFIHSETNKHEESEKDTDKIEIDSNEKYCETQKLMSQQILTKKQVLAEKLAIIRELKEEINRRQTLTCEDDFIFRSILQQRVDNVTDIIIPGPRWENIKKYLSKIQVFHERDRQVLLIIWQRVKSKLRGKNNEYHN